MSSKVWLAWSKWVGTGRSFLPLMISLGCSLKLSANRPPISPMYTVDGHFNFAKRIFYLIFIIAPLSSTFVERAMRISFKRLIKKYLDLYLETTHLHTPLFLQKSTVLCCVTSAFRIFSYCYIRVCFTLLFLLIWRICFHSGPLPMIFVRGKYILWLSRPKTTAYGLNSFSYFSAYQWKALLDFFRTSFIEDFKTEIHRVLPLCRFFGCIY